MRTALSTKPTGANRDPLLLIPFKEAGEPGEFYINRLLLKSQENIELKLIKLRLLKGRLILHSQVLPIDVFKQAVYFGIRDQKLCLGIVSASLDDLNTVGQSFTVEQEFAMQNNMDYDFMIELNAFQARFNEFIQ